MRHCLKDRSGTETVDKPAPAEPHNAAVGPVAAATPLPGSDDRRRRHDHHVRVCWLREKNAGDEPRDNRDRKSRLQASPRRVATPRQLVHACLGTG